MPPAARTVGARTAHIHRAELRALAPLPGRRPLRRATRRRRRPRPATSCAGDERRAGRRRSAAWSRSHCPATTASWCSPSTSWTLGDRRRRSAWPACRPRARPPRRRTGPAWRGCAPRAARRRAGRRRGRRPPSRSFFHGFAHQIAELELEVGAVSRTTGTGARRREQAVDQREVARRERIPASSSSRAAASRRRARPSSRRSPAAVGRRAARRPCRRAGRAARRCRAPRRAGRPAT